MSSDVPKDRRSVPRQQQVREAEEARSLLRRGFRQHSPCPSACGGLLLRSPSEAASFCVRCQDWVEEEGEADVQEEEAEVSLRSAFLFRKFEEQLLDRVRREVDASDEGGLRAEENPSNSKTSMSSTGPSKLDRVSAVIGERMLQGWALLAEHCETCDCPRLRRPRSTETVCPSCEDDSNNDKNGSASPPKVVGAASGQASSSPEADEDDDEDASSDPAILLGEFMLRGWTLLAESCPNCNTPLVRSREGEMRCVKCKLRVVRESELGAEDGVLPSSADVAAPAPASGSSPSEEEEDAQLFNNKVKVMSPSRRPPVALPEVFVANDEESLPPPRKQTPASQPWPQQSASRKLRFDGALPNPIRGVGSPALGIGSSVRPVVVAAVGSPGENSPGRKRRRSVVVAEPVAESEMVSGPGGGVSASSFRARISGAGSLAAQSLLAKLDQMQALLTQTDSPSEVSRLAESIAELARALGLVEKSLL